MSRVTVTVPPHLMYLFSEVPDGVTLLPWDLASPPPASHLDMVVIPAPNTPLDHLAGVTGTLIQGPFIGYEAVEGRIPPGWVFANAASVHEAGTAELTIGLIIAAIRGIPRMVLNQNAGRWDQFHSPSLADSKVLILGFGGVARAVYERLLPFEVTVERVATTARVDEFGPIHGIDELDTLLPAADIVIVVVPLNERTEKMINDQFLTAMKDGAMLVNIARGKVADTDALVRHADRIQLVLDVTDPEPLPDGHPLFEKAALIAPHVGGQSDATYPRYAALIRRQWNHLLAGSEPENIVLRG